MRRSQGGRRQKSLQELSKNKPAASREDGASRAFSQFRGNARRGCRILGIFPARWLLRRFLERIARSGRRPTKHRTALFPTEFSGPPPPQIGTSPRLLRDMSSNAASLFRFSNIDI